MSEHKNILDVLERNIAQKLRAGNTSVLTSGANFAGSGASIADTLTFASESGETHHPFTLGLDPLGSLNAYLVIDDEIDL